MGRQEGEQGVEEEEEEEEEEAEVENWERGDRGRVVVEVVVVGVVVVVVEVVVVVVGALELKAAEEVRGKAMQQAGKVWELTNNPRLRLPLYTKRPHYQCINLLLNLLLPLFFFLLLLLLVVQAQWGRFFRRSKGLRNNAPGRSLAGILKRHICFKRTHVSECAQSP
jgi:hypothetical protein